MVVERSCVSVIHSKRVGAVTQTKTGSFVEALSNIGVGFTLNWTLNILTLPVLWNPASPKLSAFYIGLVFTAASLARQFIIRRYFNKAKFGNVEATA